MKEIRVCIDPGHGGHDPGALGPSGLRESDMALDVCKRIRAFLEPHVHVVMTREDDSFVTLTKRAQIANESRCCRFLSYHFNSATSVNATGWEIYTTPGQNNSDKLATSIAEHHKTLFPNQRQRSDWSDGDIDKEANFAVIRQANMPAVLMEGEFIHTSHGETFIKSHYNRILMAQAAAFGILDDLGIIRLKPDPVILKTDRQRIDDLEKKVDMLMSHCNLP